MYASIGYLWKEILFCSTSIEIIYNRIYHSAVLKESHQKEYFISQ